MSGGTAPKVAVLMGGPSAEREVSLSSGRECVRALEAAGFTLLNAGGFAFTKSVTIQSSSV